MAETAKSEPRKAASVILVREGDGGAEVYLLRRHRKASFMSSSFVFPGGIAEAGEEDLRETAARELFEEAGVLLTSRAPSQEELDRWRRAVNIDKASFGETLGACPPELDLLHYFAHWITPSVEPRRYSAQFFLARMPEGQIARPDNEETVDEIWISPAEALQRAGELRLPPPQLRTFYELLEPAKQGVDGIFAAARSAHQGLPAQAILPRGMASDEGLTLLLPWDADYESLGQGDRLAVADGHPSAWGPSRFILGPGGWRHE